MTDGALWEALCAQLDNLMNEYPTTPSDEVFEHQFTQLFGGHASRELIERLAPIAATLAAIEPLESRGDAETYIVNCCSHMYIGIAVALAAVKGERL